ncbi:MAG: helix-turn-helix domain-containing protein [Luteolibacter sp.]
MKLLPVTEAAAVLGVSKRTLQQLTSDRAVSFIKFGRNVRYDEADLERFAEARKVRAIGWKSK